MTGRVERAVVQTGDERSDLLKRAERLVSITGLQKLLVIDADVHHLDVIRFLAPYARQPWRHLLESAPLEGLVPSDVGDRSQAGRIKIANRAYAAVDRRDRAYPRRAVRKLVADLTRLGVDYSVLFPNDLLSLSLNPQRGFENEIAFAYARWMTEEILPHEDRLFAMLYLPFGDAAASLEIIERFGGRRGIAGYMVTGLREDRVFRNEYFRIYRALEERGQLLGFHSTGHWETPPYRMFDSFLAAHALSFPYYNAVHLVNLVLNGIPELFPGLRFAFFEAGAAVLPMLMARLDTAFHMRPSEAPLLKRLPSEYMREFFYTVQPIESPDRPGQMKAIFDEIGRSRILFASDYPHWDFDLPYSMTNLGFLSDEDKRNILALNAVRAFGLRVEELALTDWKRRQA